MHFYIDIEKRKNELLEKIQNGNLSFNEDERLLIESEFKLKQAFYQKLLEGRQFWTETITNFFYNNIEGEDIEHLTNDHFYYLCLSLIDQGNLDDLTSILDYTERGEEIYAYLLEKLRDSNYTIGNNFGIFVAEALIETGRYDLFSKLQRGYYNAPVLDRDNLKKVLEHYPYSFDKLCLPMDKEVLEEARKNYKALNVYELFEQMRNNPEEVFPILKEKLFSENIDISYSLEENSPVSEFYNMLLPEEYKIFHQKMVFLDLSWYFQHTTREEVIKNIELIAKSLKKNVISRTHMIKYLDILLRDNRIMDSLLESNQLGIMLASPILKDYVPKIMDRINKGDLKLLSRLTSEEMITLFSNYPELLRAAIKKDVIPTRKASTLLANEKLYVIINEEIHKENATINLPSLSLEEAKSYIRSGNIKMVLKNISLIPLDSRKDKILLTEEECMKLIDSIKEDLSTQDVLLRIANAFIFSNPTVLKFYLHSNTIMLEKTIDYINHHEDLAYLYTDSLYQEVKEYYAAKYNLSIEQLDKLESSFGPTVIRYIENETILKIVQLNPEQLDKLIQLFPRMTYDMSNVETMYDSLKQYAFSKECPNIVNIFARIKHSIEDDTSDFIKDLEELVSVIDNKFYKYLEKKNPTLIDSFKASPVTFLKDLISQMKSSNPEEKENALRILHIVTDYYISYKREEYRQEYHMVEELALPYELDSKDLEKKLLLYVFQDSQEYLNPTTGTYSSLITFAVEELVRGGMDKTLAENTLLYYLKKKEFAGEELVSIKKTIRFIIPVMKKVMDEHLTDSYLKSCERILDDEGAVKRNYYVPEAGLDMYQLLSSLRLDVIEKNLLEANPKNDMLYQSLQATIKKYKLHVMPNCFQQLLESEHVQISSDLTNLSSFISYYYQIYETERKRLESQGKDSSHLMLSATNVLLNASVFAGVSSVYSQILGSEDAKLVKANPGPNAAIYKTAGDGRLKEAVGWTIKNFRRMEVSIPTFTEDISIREKQSLRAVVGNFTHPSNITHGERTGACMRIGGVGETLLNFCLEDTNGFHIRFEDANTGEYISRVSGFRNGNTVFLNELRNSCNKSLYSDEDVIAACTRVAEMLIEKSKDSTCPIENVVVASAYATEHLPEIGLGISNNKKGLKAFYSDIQSSGIVLASTGEPYTKIDFDKSQVPTYLPAREKAYIGTDSVKLMDMMNRVHSIKRVLSGENYEYVEPLSFENDIVYGIVNQDWYICMDSLGNISEEIISIDKRAKEELEIARKMIAEYIPEKKEEDTYQY